MKHKKARAVKGGTPVSEVPVPPSHCQCRALSREGGQFAPVTPCRSWMERSGPWPASTPYGAHRLAGYLRTLPPAALRERPRPRLLAHSAVQRPASHSAQLCSKCTMGRTDSGCEEGRPPPWGTDIRREERREIAQYLFGLLYKGRGGNAVKKG